MKPGDRVREGARKGTLVAFQPQNMADVHFDDKAYPIRRPVASLVAVRDNPGPRGGLTAAERAALPESDFALPGRRWPIPDKAHARIATTYMKRGFGRKADYPQIQRAIRERFPGFRPNPKKKEEEYDPKKEQFRAQVQGIYEANVKTLLGYPTRAPFTGPEGERLDACLSAQERRDQLSKAFAIATRQGQKHGWLEPGTQTPTPKGIARAYERLQNATHAAANRRDYEITLASARKDGFFRVVPQDGTFTVEPRAEALKYIHIPPYRVTRAAAEADARRAEDARHRTQMLPARRNPEDENTKHRSDTFEAMTPEEARHTIVKLVQNLRRYEQSLNNRAAEKGKHTPVEIPPGNFRTLRMLLESRDDLGISTVEEAMALAPMLPYSLPSGTLRIQEAMLGTEAHPGPIRAIPGWYKTAAQWVKLEALLTKEAVKSATEGSKTGGIAGSGKAQATSHADAVLFQAMLDELNAARNRKGPDGKSLIDHVAEYLAALPPEQRPRKAPTMEEGQAPPPKHLWPLLEAKDVYITRDLFESKVKPIGGVKDLGQKAEISGEVKHRTENQELALERQQIAREVAKARRGALAATGQPFYDVERTVLLYKFEQKTDMTQSKRYYVYVLSPGETLEQVIAKEKFVPSVNEAGVPDTPTIETRYVLYIPRKPRFVGIQERAGGVAVLAAQTTRGAVRAPKGLGLREDQMPEQERRPKRKMKYFEEGGMLSEKSFKIWPSMILTRFFYVNADGIGGKEREQTLLNDAAAAPQSGPAAERLLDGIGNSPEETMTQAGMEAFLDTFRMFKKAPRAGAAAAAGGNRKPFLSPDQNWVRYRQATSIYTKVRKGSWNAVVGAFEGGIRDFPQYDVFYTTSAPLAYLTIMYFNTPELLEHVDTEIASVRNVLEVLPARTVKAADDVYEVDVLSMKPQALLAQIRLTPEILRRTLSLQNRGLRPVPPRPDLSVSPHEFHRTGLGLIMGARTEEQLAQSQMQTSRAAMEVKSMEQRQAAVQAARRPELPRKRLGVPAPRPAALPDQAGASDTPDLSFLLEFNNPYRRLR